LRHSINHLFVCLVLIIGSQPAIASDPTHLRLKDLLDRPTDGYCVDVHGTPGNLRIDLPLFAHNCKSRLTPDSAVIFVAGVNSHALPGTAVLLHKCGESTAFFETSALQQFTLHSDGQLELKQSGLCLAVGLRSAVTYSSSDRWRPLFLDDCAVVEARFSQWQFSLP